MFIQDELGKNHKVKKVITFDEKSTIAGKETNFHFSRYAG